MAYEAFQSVAFNQGDVSGYLGASYNKRGEFQDSHGDRIGPEVAQTDRQDTETVDVNGRLVGSLLTSKVLALVRNIIMMNKTVTMVQIMDQV
jgi:iron complex outermembrane receptor protein